MEYYILIVIYILQSTPNLSDTAVILPKSIQ